MTATSGFFRIRIAAILFVVGFAGPGPAACGAEEVLVLYPGSPGTRKQAEPVMTALARYLGEKAGVEIGEAVYETDREKGLERLRAEKGPAIAIVSPEIYVTLAAEGADIELLAQAVRDGKTSLAYHLVAREGTTLEDLAGKAVHSSHAANPIFASRVLLGGRLDVTAKGMAVYTRRPLGALRDLVRGDVDAVLLDESQYEAMKSVASLKPAPVSIFASDPVPTAPVLAFRTRIDEARRERVRRVFLEMIDVPDGQDLLKALQVTRFDKPDLDGYAALRKRAEED